MVIAMRIFVGNLALDTTRDDLRRLFADYGRIERVGLAKEKASDTSPGYGLVEMMENADGERAITALDGTLFRERPLRVREARTRTKRDHSNVKK